MQIFRRLFEYVERLINFKDSTDNFFELLGNSTIYISYYQFSFFTSTSYISIFSFSFNKSLHYLRDAFLQLVDDIFTC